MFRKKRTVNLKLWASRLLKSWGTRIYNFCIWSSRSWTSLWSWGLNLLTQPRRASWSFGRSGPCFLGQEWRPTFYFFLGSECLRLRGKRTLTGAPLRERLNRKKKKRMRLDSERKKGKKEKGDERKTRWRRRNINETLQSLKEGRRKKEIDALLLSKFVRGFSLIAGAKRKEILSTIGVKVRKTFFTNSSSKKKRNSIQHRGQSS